MIQLRPITTTDEKEYRFMEELLTTSFPSEEYRPLAQLREYTDNCPNFVNNLIVDEGEPVGFITYWDFGRFYYVEHFATHPGMRNSGYGKRTLELLCKLLTRPIVLEVERPDNETAQRRIGFYQRQGFKLWQKDYFQPPYKEGDGFLPMYIMVYGELDEDSDFGEVKRTLHTHVYGLAEE